jgi:hypothetical protein
LITALKDIVHIYEEELAPYAVSLCSKLAEAYRRAVNSDDLDEDPEEVGVTAISLMSTIRRLL